MRRDVTILKGFEAEGWRGMLCMVASVDGISRGNLGMV